MDNKRLPPIIVEPLEPVPWWRTLDWWDWIGLVFGAVSVLCLIGGVITGEVLFLPPGKNGGRAIEATWNASPVLYVILMALNAALAVLIWTMFFIWLKRIRARTASAVRSDA